MHRLLLRSSSLKSFYKARDQFLNRLACADWLKLLLQHFAGILYHLSCTPRLLKDGGKALRDALAILYTDILKPDAVVPCYWKETKLRVLFKKGDPQLAENYRPIAIIPILYKVFSKVVNARIKDILLAAQTVDQAGFRPGFCCDDHLFAITLITEKMNQFQQPLWIAAVDFRKAFDTIEHDALLEALLEQGVPPTYVNCLRKLYEDQKGYVQTDKRSQKFSIERGTKQGDPISPSLFNAALEKAMGPAKRKWYQKKWGLKLAYGRDGNVTNLRFADDILLIGKSLFQVQEMLADLAEGARSVGLEMHPNKTKILNNGLGNQQAQRRAELAGWSVEILQRSESTMYLGRLLNLCDPHDTEIDFRIKRGWAKFAMYKKDLTDKHYSLFQRLRLFHSVVTPTILYGCASWAMTAAREQQLRTVQRKMLRSILGQGRQLICQNSSLSSTSAGEANDHDEQETLENWVQWKQRTTREARQALDKIGIPDWADEQRRRLWKWAGHVAQRCDGRWSKRALCWFPEGPRLPGRPKRRWEDSLNEYCKYRYDHTNWVKLAQDREEWARNEGRFVRFYSEVGG